MENTSTKMEKYLKANMRITKRMGKEQSQINLETLKKENMKTISKLRFMCTHQLTVSLKKRDSMTKESVLKYQSDLFLKFIFS